jgi:hypothetical protein
MQYATPADLGVWLDPDPAPANANRLLRSASGLVRNATAGARYAVDADGLPTDPRIATAFLEATLAQAEAWAANGIDPTKGVAQLKRTVQSKSADGRSVTYADNGGRAALEALASGTELVGQARSILSNAGLISNRIQATPGYVRDVEVVSYDPTTGVLDR